MTNCALPAIPNAIEWAWDSDWFSSQKPTLADGCFYAWKGYWFETIEKDQEQGKSLFNWGYAGPFSSTEECNAWIKSHDAEESLERWHSDAKPGRCDPEVSSCQPDQKLHRGIRPYLPLRRTKSFPIGNGIDPPWY